MAYELIDEGPAAGGKYELLPEEPTVRSSDPVRRAANATIPLIGPVLAAFDINPDVPQIAKGVASGFADLGNTLINRGTKVGAEILPTSSSAQYLLPEQLRRPERGLNNLITGQEPMSPAEKANAERSKSLEQFNEENKGGQFAAGRLIGNVAATYPVGGAIAAPLRAAAPVLAPLADAVATGGFRTGLAPTTLAGKVGNVALRSAGGAASGAASVAAIDPNAVGTGALIGAALPVGAATFGKAGELARKALIGRAPVTPEVAQLAQRAEQLGITVPADRLTDSKPLNAIAAGLNYVPFSGRAATEDAMQSGLNRALSRTFGQNSDNVTMALRQAQTDLGAKFDTVLKNNPVTVDQQLMTDLANASNKAVAELPADLAGVITRQVDEIVAKGATGQIDGQAAYNLKKTLDQIGKRTSAEAYYARDLRSALMGALDRSLGAQQAADFALTRRQYGNMLSLQNLAKNGAEGDVSIARLANMKNIRSPDLQELADISAQFLRPREGAHGAAQRATAGLTAGYFGGIPALAGSIAAGRMANGLLNSGAARNAVLGTGGTGLLGASIPAQGLFYRAAPALLRDQ